MEKRVIYFGASHCVQCRFLKPRFEDLCRTRGIPFEDVDVDGEDPRLVEYGVRGIPFAVLLVDGELKATGHAADVMKRVEEYA